MSEELVLEVQGITKTFGPVRALNDVTFSLRKGEILALVGENGARKSTLMNIINGILQPNSGEIRVRGQVEVINSPEKAQQLGIGLVHQEIALCPNLSVAENISMAATNRRRSFLMNYKQVRRRAAEVLATLGDIDPDMLVSQLSISEQQIVEIAKSLVLNCSILIFDEPTAALTEREAGKLFRIMADLKVRGISMIYISHRMAEIFSNCDRFTVLRDGSYVCTEEVAETDPQAIVRRMVGRILGDLYPRKNPASASAPVLLSSDAMSDGERFIDVSLNLREGEGLGIAGLIGSDRTETALSLTGLCKLTAGKVYLRGQDVTPASYSKASAMASFTCPKTAKVRVFSWTCRFLKMSPRWISSGSQNAAF